MLWPDKSDSKEKRASYQADHINEDPNIDILCNLQLLPTSIHQKKSGDRNAALRRANSEAQAQLHYDDSQGNILDML